MRNLLRHVAYAAFSITLAASVAYATQVFNDNVTVNGKLTVATPAGSSQITGSNAVDFTVANPTGNATGTFKWQGIGADPAALAFTPKITGNAEVVITYNETNGTATDGGNVKCSFGTGTAPANAATTPAFGTQIGSVDNYVGGTTTNPTTRGVVQGRITGLTLGVAIWVDCQTQDVTGGTFTLTNVHAYVRED